MKYKSICWILVLIFAFCVATPVAAEDPTGNARKGRYTYKKVYKQCHQRGEVDTEKPAIDPDSKTQAQWKRIFKKRKFKEFGCAKEFDNLSDTELDNILAYLWKGAADSPTPAKCK